MASEAAQARYEQAAERVAAKLRENGRLLSFGRQKPSDTPTGPAGPYEELGTLPVLPLEWSADFSDDVRRDDVFYMVSAELDLELCSKMIDGKELSIYKIKPLKLADQVIYYEIQARV